MEKVKMQLVGLDGNAFGIMGAFQSAARKQGIPAEEIKSILKEAMSGDYSHLIAVIASNVDDSDFDPEDEEEEGCEWCGDCDCDGECEDEE